MITVLLPVRDGAEYVVAALESLAAQTLDDFRALVLDDGSLDETRALVEAFARGDSRFQLRAFARQGLIPTLQRGLAEVGTPFVARMDADDLAEPDRLRTQLSFLRSRTELAGCGAGVRIVAEADVSDRARAYEHWLNSMVDWSTVERDLFVECPLAHPTFFFRREALEAVGGYQDRGWPEDYDLLLRLWRAGHRFVAVPEVLLQWTDRPGRLSRTGSRYSQDAFRRCRVHHLAASHLRAGRPAVVWGAGPTGKAYARLCLEMGIPVEAFAEVDPRKIGQTIHGVEVVTAREAVVRAGAFHLGPWPENRGGNRCENGLGNWASKKGFRSFPWLEEEVQQHYFSIV